MINRGRELARAETLIAARNLSLGVPLVIQTETVSTNDDAKAGARAGSPHGSAWLAEAQTGGRGRQGRAWISPPGTNLLCSVLLRLGCSPARVPLLSLAAGLAVRDTVAHALGDQRNVVVKWPNDVLIEGKTDGTYRKVAGVLVESALAGAHVESVVVGVGLNVHMLEMPDILAGVATSLAREGAEKLDRAELFADILERLAGDANRVAEQGLAPIHARLTQADGLRGRHVESAELKRDGTPAISGVASGIDVEGYLCITMADGSVTRIGSGEVRLRVR